MENEEIQVAQAMLPPANKLAALSNLFKSAGDEGVNFKEISATIGMAELLQSLANEICHIGDEIDEKIRNEKELYDKAD
ncbi:MAG: hypothetical protein H8D67_31495 [Deltaproteobacteria bacterium]|nr:hypothetical protein [Deltaproteobacteria bacterium]